MLDGFLGKLLLYKSYMYPSWLVHKKPLSIKFNKNYIPEILLPYHSNLQFGNKILLAVYLPSVVRLELQAVQVARK